MNMNLKPKHLFLAIVATALISCIITASLVLSTTTTSTFYISGGVYPGAPSYTVWIESGTYFAKNANGKIDFYGSLFSVVVQSCITTLTSGGHILFKNGQYYTEGIEINVSSPGIGFYGEGVSTEIILNQGTTKSVFVVTKPNFRFDNFVINSTTTLATEGKGIAVDGAFSLVTDPPAWAVEPDRVSTVNVIREMIIENQFIGIEFSQASRQVSVENVEIRNPWYAGIIINNASFLDLETVIIYGWRRAYNVSLDIVNGYTIKVRNCEFLGAQKFGVIAHPGANLTELTQYVEWAFFEKVYVEINQTAWSIANGFGDGWVFSTEEGGDRVKGMYLDQCWGVSCRNGLVMYGVDSAIITASQFHGNDESGIVIESGTKNVVISNNEVGLNSWGSYNDPLNSDIRVQSGAGNVTIVGNNIFGSGVHLEPITQRDYAGIWIHGANGTIINANIIGSHGTYGIYIHSNVSDYVITGNLLIGDTINDNGVAPKEVDHNLET